MVTAYRNEAEHRLQDDKTHKWPKNKTDIVGKMNESADVFYRVVRKRQFTTVLSHASRL